MEFEAEKLTVWIEVADDAARLISLKGNEDTSR